MVASVRTARRALAVLATLALPACLTDLAGFVCSGDASCRAGQRCIDAACASPDGACPSGARWDETAGDRAGQCAVDSDAQVPDPNCGNGLLEDYEKCDDGQGSPTPCPTPADCNDGEPCTDDLIAGEACQRTCVYTFRKDGDRCGTDGGTGQCLKRTCCTGCVEGGRCTSGDQPASCGGGGAACASCVADGGSCQSSFCQSGGCTAVLAADDSPCPGGACTAGSCCTGCVLPTDGGYECKNGGSTQSCGSGGSDCVQCQFGCDRDGGGHCTGCAPDCSGKSCGSDGCGGSCGSCAVGKMCVGGSCQCANAGPELGDIACSNGIDDDCNGQTDCADAGCAAARCANMAPGQFCRQGICSSGCRIGAQIFAAGAVNPANSCQSCQPNVDDSAWTALTDGSPCLDASLENGQCHSAACCIRCWDGQGCRDSNASHCGLGGVACVNCVDANPCTANLCSNGTCSNPPLADGTLCHATTCANGAGCPGCGPSTPSTTCRLGDACQGGVCSMAVVGIGCCDGVNSNCCVTAGSSMCCP